MSDIAVVAGGRAARRDGPDTGPDTRRVLQLALAGLWLLDALLQYQPMMFSRAFGQTLAATADGNPGFIARPITWDATLIQQHAVALNVVFATIQLLLGLGIAFRPTARLALAASVAWSAGVWWFGESLGGVLTGTASPVTGAPGAAILYALLAVLLWPARPVGARAGRAPWLVLWLALAWLALQPANRAPWALHDTLAGMGSGEPGRMAALERDAAAVIGGHGLAASIVLAAAFTLVAVGVYLPRPAAVTALVLAIAIAGVTWVIGEAFGMILAGGATDPDTGPLLALLALAYWPARTAPGEGGRS
jgi:hypothetical protein